MCWAAYGIRPEELDEETAEWLVQSYVRRKRWEFQEQANAVGQMLTGKVPAQPPAPTAAAPATPARVGGLERSRTGKVFTRVSADHLMQVVQARRLPAQG